MRVDRKAATIIGSDKARALQKSVWKEVIDELKANVPELQADLDGLYLNQAAIGTLVAGGNNVSAYTANRCG